jgi:hypothetical protein
MTYPATEHFVLGGMANHGGSAADMISGLGVSKQAASQLIDALVLRGYLTREINPEDRRRMVIGLTETGPSRGRRGPGCGRGRRRPTLGKDLPERDGGASGWINGTGGDQ